MGARGPSLVAPGDREVVRRGVRREESTNDENPSPPAHRGPPGRLRAGPRWRTALRRHRIGPQGPVGVPLRRRARAAAQHAAAGEGEVPPPPGTRRRRRRPRHRRPRGQPPLPRRRPGPGADQDHRHQHRSAPVEPLPGRLDGPPARQEREAAGHLPAEGRELRRRHAHGPAGARLERLLRPGAQRRRHHLGGRPAVRLRQLEAPGHGLPRVPRLRLGADQGPAAPVRLHARVRPGGGDLHRRLEGALQHRGRPEPGADRPPGGRRVPVGRLPRAAARRRPGDRALRRLGGRHGARARDRQHRDRPRRPRPGPGRRRAAGLRHQPRRRHGVGDRHGQARGGPPARDRRGPGVDRPLAGRPGDLRDP